MSRMNQKIGQHGQNQAASYLSSIGLLLVEEIGTPVTTIPVKNIPAFAHRKDIFRVFYGNKVSGDTRALMPDGASVLIETKTVLDGNLTYSHMREHQPYRLSRHAKIGKAVSLLVWVHGSGIYVMRWGADGIAGFGPGKSIKQKQARILHDEFIEFLNAEIKNNPVIESDDDLRERNIRLLRGEL